MVISKNTRQGNIEKPLRFRVKPPESQWYSSLDEFLRSARVISSSSPLYELAQASANARARQSSGLDGYEGAIHGAPWLSFVLGSGCLTLSDGVSSDRSELAPLYEAFRELDARDPRLALGGLAADFFERLLVEREVTDTGNLVAHDPEVKKDWALAADVTLAAALATKTYATALSHSAHILTASYRERVEFDPEDDEWYESQTRLVDPFADVLRQLFETSRSETGARQVLGKLCESVRQALTSSRGELLRANVELLTGFAWYFVTLGTATYPGWSELLLIEALQASMIEAGDSPARPHLRDLTNETFSTLALFSVSQRSWATRAGNAGVSSRDRFYDSVAEVLKQQARVYSSSTGLGSRPPMPVAHVTSFDLELEMALWSAGRPFVVVMPVLAISEDYGINSASVHWLWTRITPDRNLDHHAQIDALRGTLKDHEWFPADEMAWGQSSVRYQGEPVVVRLAGSPLMQVPHRGPVGIAADQPLHHALLLDEYSAWHQAVLELSQLRGLAKAFTRATSDVPRFWMFLGTQLSDGAIRIRLLTHEFAALAADYRGGAQGRNESMEGPDGVADDSDRSRGADSGFYRAGIVVNRWSRATDRDLFHWHRLDVVQASHRELQPYLDEFIVSFDDKRLARLENVKVSAA